MTVDGWVYVKVGSVESQFAQILPETQVEDYSRSYV